MAERPLNKGPKAVQCRVRPTHVRKNLFELRWALVGARLGPKLLLYVSQELKHALKLINRSVPVPKVQGQEKAIALTMPRVRLRFLLRKGSPGGKVSHNLGNLRELLAELVLHQVNDHFR